MLYIRKRQPIADQVNKDKFKPFIQPQTLIPKLIEAIATAAYDNGGS